MRAELTLARSGDSRAVHRERGIEVFLNYLGSMTKMRSPTCRIGLRVQPTCTRSQQTEDEEERFLIDEHKYETCRSPLSSEECTSK
jgi:hypothetical protein